MITLVRTMTAICLGISLLAVSPTALAMGGGSDSPFAGSRDQDYKDAVRAIERKNYDRAVKLLADVIKDQPRNADALNYMGFSQRKLGKYAEAVDFYQKALAVDANHRGANEYLGEAYLELKDLAKAEDRLTHLAKICNMSCEEYKTLKTSVDLFKSGQTRPQQSSVRW